MKLSIVIVSYKKSRELLACLKSIYTYAPKCTFEIIIVDNAQDLKLQDKIGNTFPKVKYLQSNTNVGYATGNNLGVEHASGEYVFILNPDTKFIDNSITKLVEFLDKNKNAAIVAPNLIHPNGVVFSRLGSRKLTPIRGIFVLSILDKIFPNNQISKKYWMLDTRLDVLREVDVIPGSALILRRRLFQSVGGFDENFFLYFEESDLCKRIKKRYPKYKFYIHLEAQIIHYWKPKTPNTNESRKIYAASRFYYFKKHYGYGWAIIVELFANLNKYHILLFLVVLLVIFLYLL